MTNGRNEVTKMKEVVLSGKITYLKITETEKRFTLWNGKNTYTNCVITDDTEPLPELLTRVKRSGMHDRDVWSKDFEVRGVNLKRKYHATYQVEVISVKQLETGGNQRGNR